MALKIGMDDCHLQRDGVITLELVGPLLLYEKDFGMVAVGGENSQQLEMVGNKTR